MRSKLEIRHELKEIEGLMSAQHANSKSYDVAYGAYQALTWVLGERQSPMYALEVMEAWAAHCETERVREPREPGK